MAGHRAPGDPDRRPEFGNRSEEVAGTGGWNQAIIGEGDRAGVCDPFAPTPSTCPTARTQLDIDARSRDGGPNLPGVHHSCSDKYACIEAMEYRDRISGVTLRQNAA